MLLTRQGATKRIAWVYEWRPGLVPLNPRDVLTELAAMLVPYRTSTVRRKAHLPIVNVRAMG